MKRGAAKEGSGGPAPIAAMYVPSFLLSQSSPVNAFSCKSRRQRGDNEDEWEHVSKHCNCVQLDRGARENDPLNPHAPSPC